MIRPMTDAPPEASPEQGAASMTRQPAVTWRSVTLGLLGVVFICTLTPYNNYVLNNTDFVGSHLPASLLVFFMTFVMLVNGLLYRLAPRRALGGGELAVALGMTLVGCALPSVGLMRYLPGHLVSLYGHSANDAEAAGLMRQLDLPDWLWPRFEQSDPAARGTEPVARDYTGRTVVDVDTFANRFAAVPWSAWVGPAVSWGVFFLALVGAVLCLSLVFRRQWVENEKLSFPLASVYLSLIEPPAPGRAVNALFTSRLFWWAFATVFLLHGFNALSVYDPQHWPAIPVRYDLAGILADDPWRFTATEFKAARVFFTIIGLMFFVQGRVAFSLWFFYVAMQVVRMGYGTYQAELTGGMIVDQLSGALIATGAAFLWVARKHLLMIGRHMVGRVRAGEPTGRYLPDAAAGWGFVLCAGALVAWLAAAGATVVGAVMIVGVMMLVYVVLARVVAETGLLYVLLPVPADRFWLYTADLTGGAVRGSLRAIFFSNWFFGMFLHDTREALPVYATHAIRVADDEAYANERNWRRAVPFLAVLGLALVVAFVVAGASSLYANYSYTTTLDHSQDTVGRWGSFQMPEYIALGGTKNYIPPKTGPIEQHSRVAHFVGGGAFTGVLAAMNLRFATWPLHPVGYLLANTWGLGQIWFSIFLGWLAKSLVVRFGGSRLYRTSRPLFIGLIFGEATAVVFWLTLSLILSSLGWPYHAIQILPV